MRIMLLGLLLALILATANGCVTPGCPPDPAIRCFFGLGYGEPPPGTAPKLLPQIQQEEVTPEPTPTTEAPVDVIVEVTEAPTVAGVVIVIEQPPAPTDNPDTVEVPVETLTESQRFFSISNVLYGLVLVIGGFGGGVGFALSRFDKEKKDNAEKLYQAMPETTQTTLLGVVNTLDHVVQGLAKVISIAKEVTDGKPNAAEPPPFTPDGEALG